MIGRIAILIATLALPGGLAAEEPAREDALFVCAVSAMQDGLADAASRPEDQHRWFAISVLGDIGSGKISPQIEVYDPDGVFPKGEVAVIKNASESGQNGFGFWFNDNPEQILAILISEDQKSESSSIKALAKFGEESGICRLNFGPDSSEVFEHLKENGFEK